MLDEDGNETIVSSSELKKGDVVMVVAGEVIPGDGEVIEGIARWTSRHHRRVRPCGA